MEIEGKTENEEPRMIPYIRTPRGGLLRIAVLGGPATRTGPCITSRGLTGSRWVLAIPLAHLIVCIAETDAVKNILAKWHNN